MSAPSSTTPALPAAVHTLVVGGGFAGLAAAAAVQRADPGADVLIIERAGEVGGTWRDNTYPGCACDGVARQSTDVPKQSNGGAKSI
jgi:cation diffusion facilitator CzcD-associated flavoprotein CzcO